MEKEKVTNEDLAKSIDTIAINLAKVIDITTVTQKDLGGVKVEVGIIKTDVSSLKTDVSQLKTDLHDLKEETRENFKGVNQKIDDLTETAEEAIHNNEGRIEVLEEKVGI